MADGKIEIEIVLEDGSVVKGFQKVGKESTKAGKKAGDNFEKGFETGLSSLKKTIIGVGAALAGAFGARAAIQASARQEDAINAINASLTRIGQFSDEASQDLQNFASELQNVTRIGDEAALEQLAFAQAMGATVEQSKLAVTAAADLAAGLNIDLNSATRNVAKTLGGYAGELGEVIPELKNFTQEQLKSGAAIDLIAEKFKGLAEAQTRTFSGALEQATNSFGDLVESIGSFVTTSPLAIGIINKISKLFTELSKSVTDFVKSGDGIRTITLALIEFGTALNTFVVAPLELAFNAAKVVFTQINSFVAGVTTGIVQNLAKIDGLLASAGISTGFTEQLKVLSESSSEVFAGVKKDADDALGGLFDFDVSTQSQEFLDQFAVFAEQFKLLKEGVKVTKEDVTPNPEETLSIYEEIANQFTNFSVGFAKDADTIKKTSAGIAQSIKQGLGNAIAGSVKKLVTNLQAGENAFSGFGDFLLGLIGDLATQMGSFLISAGLGILALSAGGLGAAASIAAGIALVALGAIISGGLGGGGTGSSGVTAGDTTIGGNNPVSQEEPDVNNEPGTNVSLTIQGDVIGDDGPSKIVNLLNDAFEKDGAVITNKVRFA